MGFTLKRGTSTVLVLLLLLLTLAAMGKVVLTANPWNFLSAVQLIVTIPIMDCVSRVCGGGGGCAGGGVPLGAGPCCPDVGRCLSGVYNHHHQHEYA